MAKPLLPGHELLVEQRIREATERGEFDRLPGAGAPLDLDDDPLVPKEMRIAHRILKNAGGVPPEVGNLAEIQQLVAQLSAGPQAAGDAQTSRRERRLRALLIQLELSGRPAAASQAWQHYQQALMRKA